MNSDQQFSIWKTKKSKESTLGETFRPRRSWWNQQHLFCYHLGTDGFMKLDSGGQQDSTGPQWHPCWVSIETPLLSSPLSSDLLSKTNPNKTESISSTKVQWLDLVGSGFRFPASCLVTNTTTVSPSVRAAVVVAGLERAALQENSIKNHPYSITDYWNERSESWMTAEATRDS